MTVSPPHQPAAPVTASFASLAIGQEGRFVHRVTSAEVELFAGLSGDDNPIHLSDAYAATTPFKARIAHGLLTASYISTVLGTRLPGCGAIYCSQSLRFRAPVYLGDEVTALATVTALDPEKRRVTLATACRVAGRTVLDGEAVLLVPA